MKTNANNIDFRKENQERDNWWCNQLKINNEKKKVFTQIGLHQTFGFRFLQLWKNMVIFQVRSTT